MDAQSSDCDYYLSFSQIQDGLDDALEIADIRKACRSLTNKGLAHYMRGLMTEDGEVAGSGYQCTTEGQELLESDLLSHVDEERPDPGT